MKLRDEKYRLSREAAYTTAVGRKYYRELSVDEMPGLTLPLRIATCLALCEALEMPCEYIAPAFGFQKNFPFPVRIRRSPLLTRHTPHAHRTTYRIKSASGPG
jgi:hypothetical protein